MMILSRDRDCWPDEALHQWRERIAMRGEDGPEAEAWAEECVRAAWVASRAAPLVWPEGDDWFEAWAGYVRAMPTLPEEG